MGMDESCEILVKFTVANPKKLENKLCEIAWRPGRLTFMHCVVVNMCLPCSIRNQSYKICVDFCHRVNSMEFPIMQCIWVSV